MSYGANVEHFKKFFGLQCNYTLSNDSVCVNLLHNCSMSIFLQMRISSRLATSWLHIFMWISEKPFQPVETIRTIIYYIILTVIQTTVTFFKETITSDISPLSPETCVSLPSPSDSLLVEHKRGDLCSQDYPLRVVLSRTLRRLWGGKEKRERQGGLTYNIPLLPTWARSCT